MREHETAALDFALSYIERHGDTQASEKAKQHRFLLAQDTAAQPDATGDQGTARIEFRFPGDSTGDNGAELAGE